MSAQGCQAHYLGAVSHCCCSPASKTQAGNLALCSAMQTDQFGYVLAQVLALHTLAQCRHAFQFCSKGCAAPRFYIVFIVKIMLMLTFANYLIVSLSAKKPSLKYRVFFSPAHVFTEEQHTKVFRKFSPRSVPGLYVPCKSIYITQLQKKRTLLDYAPK